MAVFAASFRLGDGPNYSARWAAVDDAVRAHVGGQLYDETTSFYVFESPATASGLCMSIFTQAGMDQRNDTLVVIDLSRKDHDMIGSKVPMTLNALLAAR